MINIKEVKDPDEKQRITRLILEELKEWFEVEESREGYIKDSANLPYFAAYDGDKPVGFICLFETGKDTVEIHVTGVLKEYHGKHSFRSRPFRWVSMKITTGPTAHILHGALRSLRYFPCSGMRIIPARSM